jgi:copper ion binding protein
MATTTLKVSGMTCGHCVKAVTEALQNLDGVRSAQVDLGAGRAVVEFEAEKVSPQAMAAAVSEEGYSAEEQT